jgi:hypothetical protein
MRRALGELDQNTPIANRRSPRQCDARARDEMPVPMAREALRGALGDGMLDAAESLVRESRIHHHSRNSGNHLTYAEALKQSGYVGDNGVLVLSRRMGAARVRGAMHRSMWWWTCSSV